MYFPGFAMCRELTAPWWRWWTALRERVGPALSRPGGNRLAANPVVHLGIVAAGVEGLDGPHVLEPCRLREDVAHRHRLVDQVHRAANGDDDGRRLEHLDAGLVLLAGGTARLRAVGVVLAGPREGRRAVRLRETRLTLSAPLAEERVAVGVPRAALGRGVRAVLEVETRLLRLRHLADAGPLLAGEHAPSDEKNAAAAYARARVQQAHAQVDGVSGRVRRPPRRQLDDQPRDDGRAQDANADAVTERAAVHELLGDGGDEPSRGLVEKVRLAGVEDAVRAPGRAGAGIHRRRLSSTRAEVELVRRGQRAPGPPSTSSPRALISRRRGAGQRDRRGRGDAPAAVPCNLEPGHGGESAGSAPRHRRAGAHRRPEAGGRGARRARPGAAPGEPHPRYPPVPHRAGDSRRARRQRRRGGAERAAAADQARHRHHALPAHAGPSHHREAGRAAGRANDVPRAARARAPLNCGSAAGTTVPAGAGYRARAARGGFAASGGAAARALAAR